MQAQVERVCRLAAVCPGAAHRTDGRVRRKARPVSVAQQSGRFALLASNQILHQFIRVEKKRGGDISSSLMPG